MPTLQAADLADLINDTLPELGELKFTDLMSDYQDTVALKRIFKKKKTTFQAGTSVRFNVILDHNGSFRFVGLFENDRVNPTDVMTYGEMPWRHMTWNWAIERREIAMNRSPRRIVNLIQTRRMAGMGSGILGVEQALWRVPATDSAAFVGIPFYIVKSSTATTTNDGFNGGLPSGYTTVAGLTSAGTSARWANYAASHGDNFTKSGLIRAMRRAIFKTDFKPLVAGMPTYAVGDDKEIYTNYDSLAKLEEMAEAQNENIGRDLASYDGQVMIRKIPVNAIKALDDDTTNPFYGINWSEFGAIGLSGEWMREETTPKVAGQHTVAATFTDSTINVICRNRRKQWVLSNGTTMPA